MKKRSARIGPAAFTAAFAFLACMAVGCGNDEGASQPGQALEARVRLPDYPYVQNDAIRIEPRLLDGLARDFLAGGGQVDEVPSFLFSFVPIRVFDGITRGRLDRLEEDEGLLYLSGFFGGVWLRKALHFRPSATQSLLLSDPAPGAAMAPLSPAPPTALSAGTRAFSFLTAFAAELNEAAREGNSAAIQEVLLNSLDTLLFLYGYNLGYLESILERPPEGVESPPGYLSCTHFLDCRTPVQGISELERLLTLIDGLADPPDSRWALMKEKVDRLGPPSRQAGYGIWNGFLSTEHMLPDDYFTLLDLSAGFLVYCQVLVLSAMDAWVYEDEEAGRVSLAVGAGMSAWIGGYGIGLISGDSEGRLPQIEARGLSTAP